MTRFQHHFCRVVLLAWHLLAIFGFLAILWLCFAEGDLSESEIYWLQR